MSEVASGLGSISLHLQEALFPLAKYANIIFYQGSSLAEEARDGQRGVFPCQSPVVVDSSSQICPPLLEARKRSRSRLSKFRRSMTRAGRSLPSGMSGLWRVIPTLKRTPRSKSASFLSRRKRMAQKSRLLRPLTPWLSQGVLSFRGKYEH